MYQAKYFETKEDKERAIALFRLLAENPGWQLVKQLLTDDVKTATQRLINDETLDPKEEAILRNGIKMKDYLINLPENLIKGLSPENDPQSQEQNLDPYYTA